MQERWEQVEQLFKDLIETEFKPYFDCGPSDDGLSATFRFCERKGEKKHAIMVKANEIIGFNDDQIRDLLRERIQYALSQ